MDIHPTTFSAAALRGRDALNAKIEWIHHPIPMEDLEKWMQRHSLPGDLFVMEAGSLTFETCARIKRCGGHAVVLESFRAGRIAKAYLKTDKVDAEKLARIYLSVKSGRRMRLPANGAKSFSVTLARLAMHRGRATASLHG